MYVYAFHVVDVSAIVLYNNETNMSLIFHPFLALFERKFPLSSTERDQCLTTDLNPSKT